MPPGELAAAVSSVPPALTEFTSLCAAVIPGTDGDLGYVAVARRGHPPLSTLHFEALTAFLQRAALAIQNARLYEQLQAQMEELRSLHEQVVRSERLAALGQLAAKVAHELNNPLASIHLYNSLLLEQPAEPEEQRRLAASVQEQVERAKRVVLDILDYSRPREARPEVVSLNLAVEHALRLVRHSAGSDGVTIIEEYGVDLFAVEVDVSQMAQVVTNLTLNAVHAMPEGGTLTISTGMQDDDLYVRFADTGLGIAKDHLEQIFEPFFTTKPAGQGTGLGLAVCRSLVEQHHGYITAESEPGVGSTFTVWLPPAGMKEATVGSHTAS
jgi:signal transduction histidine kinase